MFEKHMIIHLYIFEGTNFVLGFKNHLRLGCLDLILKLKNN